MYEFLDDLGTILAPLAIGLLCCVIVYWETHPTINHSIERTMENTTECLNLYGEDKYYEMEKLENVQYAIDSVVSEFKF